MKKKFVKYDEWGDLSFKKQIEKGYKQSYRRNWDISDIIIFGDRWLVKWKRRL